jgi:alkyl sulfatase BDS1-like metallo-beta-lactamase superfamily hydrolase
MSDADPITLFRAGLERTEPLKINEAIYQAVGFGNTFMVTTDEGNVIIDTSLPPIAPFHKKLLSAVDDGPTKYIILTHGHPDHRGGVSVWKEEGTEVIAQEEYPELRHYQERLAGMFARRNSQQYAGAVPRMTAEPKGNYGADVEATKLFKDEMTIELGGLLFEVIHTPGETYEQCTVWIPEYKAAFVGDNFYNSFPNIYTLRGCKPRWALDYVESIDKVLALEPEVVLPSHGMPVYGKDEIKKQLTKYRDAILHVHDATVKGMNDGKDVYTLMREITLPEELDVGEGYGTVAWSVRGIYEGYVGWFDEDVATMYSTPPSAIHGDLVAMAGGPEAVAKKAEELAAAGKAVEALHMSDAALNAAPDNEAALRAKLVALEALDARCTNSNERGWLRSAMEEVKGKIASAE